MGFMMSTEGTTGVHVTYLGDFSLSLNGAVISDQSWKRKTARTIIKLLILKRPNVVTIDQLIEACESHTPSANNRQSIYSRISDIRHILEPGLERANQSGFIAKKGEGYAFVYDGPITVDIEIFEKALASGIDAYENKEWEDAAALHSDAIALYTGDFLCEDLYEDWTTPYREKYRTKLLQALERAACISQQQRHLQEGIEYLNRAIEIEPHHERFYQQKMELHALVGEKEQALECFTECERVLDDYLGLEPSKETRELFQAIIDEEIGVAALAIQNNLPKQINSFIGRQSELDQLHERFDKADCHLVTILGPGGIGKTRLALEFAEELLERGRFPDGIFYVAVERVGSEFELVKRIASAMKIEFSGGTDSSAQLFDQIQDRECLLILDSFESAMDQTKLVDELIRKLEHLKCLVTSRERMRLSEEWIFDLDGLEHREDHASNEDFQTTAEQLFIERSAQMEAEPTATTERSAVQKICALCEGMPLAIELAAALTRIMPCEQILSNMQENLAILKTDFSDLKLEHRSINAAFEGSFSSCDVAEQKAFLKLTLFPSGFTEEAASNVASASISTLSKLVDKSMLRMRSDCRYHFHDLIRQFGNTRLLSDKKMLAKAKSCFASYYENFIQTQLTELIGPNQVEVLNEIDLEFENIRAVNDLSIESCNYELLVKICKVFSTYFEFNLLYPIGSYFFQDLIDRLELRNCNDPADPLLMKLKTRSLGDLGHFKMRIGEYSQSRDILNEAITMARANNHKNELRLALSSLSSSEAYLGNMEQAIELANQLDSEITSEMTWNDRATHYGSIGIVFFRSGQYEKALEFFKKPLDHTNKLSPLTHLMILSLVGNIYYYLGKLASAKEYWEACFEHPAISESYKGYIMHNLGLIYAADGVYDLAIKYLLEGYSSSIQVGHHIQGVFALERLTEIAIDQNQHSKATQYIDQMMSIFDKTQSSQIKATALHSAAAFAIATDDQPQTHELINEAWEIQIELKDQYNLSRLEKLKAAAELHAGNWRAANEHLKKALGLAHEIQNQGLMLNIAIDQIMLLYKQKQYALCAKLISACLVQDSLEKRHVGELETLLSILESELGSKAFQNSIKGAEDMQFDQLLDELQSVSISWFSKIKKHPNTDLE